MTEVLTIAGTILSTLLLTILLLLRGCDNTKTIKKEDLKNLQMAILDEICTIQENKGDSK